MISLSVNNFKAYNNRDELNYLNGSILSNVYISNMSPMTEANLSNNKLRQESESIMDEFI